MCGLPRVQPAPPVCRHPSTPESSPSGLPSRVRLPRVQPQVWPPTPTPCPPSKSKSSLRILSCPCPVPPESWPPESSPCPALEYSPVSPSQSSPPSPGHVMSAPRILPPESTPCPASRDQPAPHVRSVRKDKMSPCNDESEAHKVGRRRDHTVLLCSVDVEDHHQQSGDEDHSEPLPVKADGNNQSMRFLIVCPYVKARHEIPERHPSQTCPAHVRPPESGPPSPAQVRPSDANPCLAPWVQMPSPRVRPPRVQPPSPVCRPPESGPCPPPRVQPAPPVCRHPESSPSSARDGPPESSQHHPCVSTPNLFRV
ncbi:hypothetical protein L3Q82_002864 [Scortum barcoo]|uniref:Uncharacterized protein n=1 Tax=Scortum barcoo TaxID=214431 RepID=A0ACB8VUV1_9TELE|nr:hypothetical protein L3Q82_002864 [Scortum barcoo]